MPDPIMAVYKPAPVTPVRSKGTWLFEADGTAYLDCVGGHDHGSTIGGNPLAMAVATAAFDIIAAPGMQEDVVAISTHLRQALGALGDRFPTYCWNCAARGCW